MDNSKKLRTYNAIIWSPDPTTAGQRVTVMAESLLEAKKKLEDQYGAGNVYHLHNPDDARRIR